MRVITTDRFLRLISEGKLISEGYDHVSLSGSDTYTFRIGRFRRQMNVMSVGVIDGRDLQSVGRTEVALDDEGFVLHRGQYAEFVTAEVLNLDARTICLLSTHPKMAQLGLDFLQTSWLVPPGSKDRLILEATNRGPCAVRLYPDMRVVKAMFFDIGDEA